MRKTQNLIVANLRSGCYPNLRHGAKFKTNPRYIKAFKKLAHQSLREANVPQDNRIVRTTLPVSVQITIAGIEPENIEPKPKLTETAAAKMDNHIARICEEVWL